MKVFHLEEYAKTIMEIKKVSRAQPNAICMNRGAAVTAGAFPETTYNSQIIGFVSSWSVLWTSLAIWHGESCVIKPEMPEVLMVRTSSPDFPRTEKSGKSRRTRRKWFSDSKCFSSQSFSSWSKYASTLRAVQVRFSAVLCCFCAHVKPWHKCLKKRLSPVPTVPSTNLCFLLSH